MADSRTFIPNNRPNSDPDIMTRMQKDLSISSHSEGSLDANLQQKWAWDRERPDSQLNPDYPRFEMKDLLDKNRQARL